VRRALRRYEERGKLSIRPAGTVDQALAYFTDMKVLHQAYWESRGQPGAFANPVFEKFHRAFIGARFAAGEIDMLRVAVDDQTIGYLYNIVHRKHVYSYQSGFAYEQDGSMKPGLVSHYLAIERNLSQDAAIYDFMAGGGQHKRSLGTVCRDMVWLRAAQPRLKFRAEALLRSLKQRLKPPPAD
jgi:CelD/BcsL family acetyltransferase involved in cellulose biosynthesis